MPAASSPESPLPVRSVSLGISQWVDRLGAVWVEGQLAQLSRRPGARRVFLTLRDVVADVSLSVSADSRLVESVSPALTEGSRVVVHGKAALWLERGSLSLQARDIRHVGVGELLARLERLRAALRAEGLLDPARKRLLPFLPRVVGVVTGRGSAAEADVRQVTRLRWPGVVLRVEAVPVQGPSAVTEVRAALARLERDPEVDVVVVARGGGSVEDLLPFSDESLCRAVAAMRTPVVSAVGHESDTPLLDLVADVRASTPTDAARRVVPDVAEELRAVHESRQRVRAALDRGLAAQTAAVAALRSRPVLADPAGALAARAAEVLGWRDRARRTARARVGTEAADVGHLLARVRALSPSATLERGYAVVQTDEGALVRRPDQVVGGQGLSIRVAGGRVSARVRADGRLRTA